MAVPSPSKSFSIERDTAISGPIQTSQVSLCTSVIPSSLSEKVKDEQSNEVVSNDEVGEVAASIHPPKHRIRLIMLALCLTVFVVVLDTFIMTTALPVIAIDFATSDAGYAWIGSGYMLAFAVVVPVWAKISDIFGRKPVLIITTTIFFAGTLIGALSKDANLLIAGRVIQGIGGGGLFVLVNICVSDLFSTSYGVVGAVIAIASAAGPLIGGALTQGASWRWCFWINLPFTGISVVTLVFLLDIHTPKVPFFQGLLAIDWLGSVTIVGATVMLLLGLQLGGTLYSWTSAIVLNLIIFGLVTFALFILVEAKITKAPLIPLRFFGNVSRVATLGVCVTQSILTTGSTYFLPLYFQIVLGKSPLMSGVYFLPCALVLSLCFLCVGHIVKKTGKYLLLIRLGHLCLIGGAGIMIDSKPYTSWPRIIFSQILLAFGMGFSYQTPMIAFQAQIDEKDVAAGTSTFQFVKTFSQTISVIFGQVIFQSQVQQRSGTLVQAGLPAGLIHVLTSGSVISSAAAIRGLTAAQQLLVRTTLVEGLNDMWIFYTVVASVGLLASAGIAVVKLT